MYLNMFIQLTILCNKEDTSDNGLTLKQREDLGLPPPDNKEQEHEWRLSRMNINHISCYYLSSNGQETIIHVSGLSLSAKETPEEIENLIKQALNGNTYSYTATVS